MEAGQLHLGSVHLAFRRLPSGAATRVQVEELGWPGAGVWVAAEI